VKVIAALSESATVPPTWRNYRTGEAHAHTGAFPGGASWPYTADMRYASAWKLSATSDRYSATLSKSPAPCLRGRFCAVAPASGGDYPPLRASAFVSSGCRGIFAGIPIYCGRVVSLRFAAMGHLAIRQSCSADAVRGSVQHFTIVDILCRFFRLSPAFICYLHIHSRTVVDR